MGDRSEPREDLDVGAAVTRSLLGWGVVAGALHLTVAVIMGLLRSRFSFTEHALSLLMLGPWGWVQAANLILTGLMVGAAAVGFHRAAAPGTRQGRAAHALGIYGAALVVSGIFAPDPVDGFPDAASTATTTTGGVLHLVAGGVAFLAVASAALLMARWHADRGEPERSRRSRVSGFVIGVSFLAGAALATTSLGVALIWVAAVTGWAWLASTSVHVYRTVPHPDLDRRAEQRTTGSHRP